ncbi:hypothetical protein B7R54_07330 [Subtercola boreus]|uniref:DUF4352 domain-containing protein n=1 Tax=Subtercola boreus TaxID=120213 RepID=A0A3E0VJM2_9MICO|nr:hypothetical protein [Subtercola boreus]RFA09057.1 hypothetical protein B7R54_07330 [Subtercola boreus]
MTEPGGGANWRTRVTSLSGKVPTKWLVTAVVALFLAGSAAFGGLNAVAADALPEVQAGSAYSGAQLRITVSRAVLIDGFPEQNITPDDGKRLFVVIATVENVWDRPVTTYDNIGAADNLRPVGVEGIQSDTPPDDVVVISDGTKAPRLQPRVPIELAYVWQVADTATVGPGDVRVDIYDKVYAAGGFVTFGARYEDPYLAAFATVPLKDVGAGANTDQSANTDQGANTGPAASPTPTAEPTS